MASNRVLIIHQQNSDCSALRSVLSRERYNVIEASLDMGKAPFDVEECCVVLLDTLAATPGGLGLRPANEPDGAPPNSPGTAKTGRRRLARRKPRHMPRKAASSLTTIKLGGKTVSLSARAVRGSLGDVRLTRLECSVLSDLMCHVNQTVPSMDLVHTLWPSDPTKGVHSLRAFIKNLRKKLEPDPAHPQYILTDLAVGYRLRVSALRRSR